MHPDTQYQAMVFNHAAMQERSRQRYLIREAKRARKAARRQADPARGWRPRRFTRQRTPVPATA